MPPHYERQHYSIHIPDKVEEIFIVTKRIILKLPYLLFLRLFLPWHCVTGVRSVIVVLAGMIFAKGTAVAAADAVLRRFLRVIGRQMRAPQRCLQNVIAGDDLILRKAPPAVHSSDARMLGCSPERFFCSRASCRSVFASRTRLRRKPYCASKSKKSPTSIRKELPEMM